MPALAPSLRDSLEANFAGVAIAKPVDSRRIIIGTYSVDQEIFTYRERPRLEKCSLYCPVIRVDQLSDVGPRFGVCLHTLKLLVRRKNSYSHMVLQSDIFKICNVLASTLGALIQMFHKNT